MAIETSHLMTMLHHEVRLTREAFASERTASLNSVASAVALVICARAKGASPTQQRELAFDMTGAKVTVKTDTAAKRFNCARNLINNMAKRDAMRDVAALCGAKEPHYETIRAEILKLFASLGLTNAEAVNAWLVTGTVTAKKTDTATFDKRFSKYLEKAKGDGDIAGDATLQAMAAAILDTLGDESALLIAATIQRIDSERGALAIMASIGHGLRGLAEPSNVELYKAA